MNTTSVLIVDDHPAFLHLVEQLLQDAPEVKIVGRAETGREALVLAATLRPQLVLMDVCMPDMSGLDAVRLLKTDTHAPQIVLMTAYDDPIYHVLGSTLGADGVVAKADLPTALLPIIESLVGVADRSLAAQPATASVLGSE